MSRIRCLAAAGCALAMMVVASPPVAAAPKSPTAIAIGHAAPDSLDPSLVQTATGVDIVNQLFDGLVSWDLRTGQSGLDLAASYTVSPDLMTWTFGLDPRAHWSDGHPITASDAVFGLQRAEDPAVNNQYAPFLTSLIASATAVGGGTVQYRLTRPAGYFPAVLSLAPTRPLPQAVVQRAGAAWLDPANIVVSGAYTLASQSATSIVLARTKRAARTAPQQVTYDVGDPTGFAAAFNAGTLDYLDPYVIGGPKAAETDPSLAAHLTITGPDDVTEDLVFNAAYGSTANSDVRHALSFATDRAGLSAAVNGPGNFAALTQLPPSVPGAAPASAGIGVAYDPTAAQAYAAAAGSAFPASVTVRYPCNGRRQAEAEFLKSNWQSVFGSGFTVNNQCWPAGQVIPQLTNPDPTVQADVTIIAWAGDYPDANNWLVDNRTITMRWTDPGYNADVADAAGASDSNRRVADYTDAQDVLLDRVAAIASLYYRPDAFISQPRLTVAGDRVENWTVA